MKLKPLKQSMMHSGLELDMSVLSAKLNPALHGASYDQSFRTVGFQAQPSEKKTGARTADEQTLHCPTP